MNEKKATVSLVVPIYNEERNVPELWKQLRGFFDSSKYAWELILINDGSQDGSLEALGKIAAEDQRIRIIDFSRNFGKEMAVTAGINHAKGDACLMMDADLQHPIAKIPDFLEKWENGAEVVIGVRNRSKSDSFPKRIGSYLFYKIINSISDTRIIPQATDFRLIDRVVIDEFNRLSEKNRMTRALIDWLGFRRELVHFDANERLYGQPGYSFPKLVRLAFNSMVSLSLFPLKLAGYLGVFITLSSGLLGLFILIDRYFTNQFYFSGPAILAVITLFLIGIVLICLGLIALYIANIHSEVNHRPMYVIRKRRTKN